MVSCTSVLRCIVRLLCFSRGIVAIKCITVLLPSRRQIWSLTAYVRTLWVQEQYAKEVPLRFAGLTRHQPHLLGSAIQGHDELPQKVHPQQPVHRGRVELSMRSTDQAVQAA